MSVVERDCQIEFVYRRLWRSSTEWVFCDSTSVFLSSVCFTFFKRRLHRQKVILHRLLHSFITHDSPEPHPNCHQKRGAMACVIHIPFKRQRLAKPLPQRTRSPVGRSRASTPTPGAGQVATRSSKGISSVSALVSLPCPLRFHRRLVVRRCRGLRDQKTMPNWPH